MSFTVRRLSPACGSEIVGLDLSKPLTDGQFQTIVQAWDDSQGVLVLRNQNITPEEHIAFSRRFGDLVTGKPGTMMYDYYLPGYPEIFRVSNKSLNGLPLGREDAGTYWHSDGSWMEKPPAASLLHALELPEIGGDTMFANMYAAFEKLSLPMQKMLDGLHVVHDRTAASSTSYGKELSRGGSDATQSAIHPLVTVHPRTGKKSIFVNPGFSARIEELSATESKTILAHLFQHAVSAETTYRHSWRLHDIVMWDNRCVLHYAVSDYKSIGVRYMQRTTVRGEKPLGFAHA